MSSTVTVDAATPEDAIDLAYNSEDMPGSLGYGAFGGASVDETGEWLAEVVTDENGDEVWTAKGEESCA